MVFCRPYHSKVVWNHDWWLRLSIGDREPRSLWLRITIGDREWRSLWLRLTIGDWEWRSLWSKTRLMIEKTDWGSRIPIAMVQNVAIENIDQRVENIDWSYWRGIKKLKLTWSSIWIFAPRGTWKHGVELILWCWKGKANTTRTTTKSIGAFHTPRQRHGKAIRSFYIKSKLFRPPFLYAKF